jgi:hypothetical protein
MKKNKKKKMKMVHYRKTLSLVMNKTLNTDDKSDRLRREGADVSPGLKVVIWMGLAKESSER